MNLFLISFIGLFVYSVILFIISQVLKNNSIADFGWGLGFVFLVIFAFFATEPLNFSALLAGILIVIWGLRLSYHNALQNLKTENKKYIEMRKDWGKYQAVNSFFKIYMLQAGLMYLMATPIILVFEWGTSTFSFFTFLGIILWLIGFYFEAVSDKQMTQFLKSPNSEDKILKTGLWKYTRHPNYFGETSIWWGIFLIILPSANGILAITSPILITYLLLFITGIPVVEAKYKDNVEYQEYARVTSKFFPLPPKK